MKVSVLNTQTLYIPVGVVIVMKNIKNCKLRETCEETAMTALNVTVDKLNYPLIAIFTNWICHHQSVA